jgi:YggT family protein
VSGLLPAAITRNDVADYVEALFLIYTILIFVRVLMSWFTRIPYNTVLNAVLEFVRETTDPYLNLFRRFVPMVRIGPGALDLSPIVAIIVLQIVAQLVVAAIRA